MSALEDMQMQQANLTANSEGSSSQSSILSSFNGLDSGRIENVQFFGGAVSFGDKSLVGMNTDEATINAMVAGIDKYIQGVQSNIDAMTNYEQSAINAFGQNVGATTNQFVEAMKKSCTAVISQLNRFKDDIQEVAKTYREKGASVVSAINNQSETISSTASSNTYEYSNGSK